VTLVLDTSFVVGLMVATDSDHVAARDWFESVDEDLVTSPLAVAEMDHLVSGRGGAPARDALWANLDSGLVAVRWWADALTETLAIARRQPLLGLVDASLAAVAHRVGTVRIATFDTHFRSVTATGHEPFKLLPADA
jgi:predicted nucleic acid-binding protein